MTSKTTISDQELQFIYINLDKRILEAENTMDYWIGQNQKSWNAYAKAFYVYRKKKSDLTIKYKKEGMKVTVIADMVQGETIKEKELLVRAEGTVKMTQNKIKLYEHKINNGKFIGKKLAPRAGD